MQVKASDGTRALCPHDQARGIPGGQEISGGRDRSMAGRALSTFCNHWQGLSLGSGARAQRASWSGSWIIAARSGRGHQFESVIYHDMGEHELSDQKEGIQYLIVAGIRRSAAHRALRLELRRLHDALHGHARAGPDQSRHCRRARYQLAQLRHHLHRALHGAAAKTTRKATSERPV